MKTPNLELVAEIASRLLVGDDYKSAARRAILLIEACEAEIAGRQFEQISHENTNKQLASEQVSFEDAVKEITHHQNIADAMDHFRQFKGAITDEMRRAGFTSRQVVSMRLQYLEKFPHGAPKNRTR